jgi:predicted AAA+ superfamily ATPase
MAQPKISKAARKIKLAPAPKLKPVLPVSKKSWPALKSFELFSGLFQDEAGTAFKKFFKWVQKENRQQDAARSLRLYRKLWKALAEREEFTRGPLVGTGLQDYWLERFLDDPNPLHRKAELVPFHQIGPALKDLYIEELEHFLVLLRTDWEGLFRQKRGSGKGAVIPSFSEMRPLDVLPASGNRARTEIKEKLLRSSLKPAQLVPEIAAYFFENGFGLFGRYRAFRWNSRTQVLEGISATDPIRLENLVGYDEQRKPLLENIQAFVLGKSANNVLLYGERGTGKSSTVKALLNAHQAKGLRLVEVLSADLKDFPAILSALRGRPEKFILFVDDLSFEENETQYKGLKALLEGSVETSPANVILIATSNRRHLVREYFSEREEGTRKDGEVHGQDTVEEKLSLADRFGLVISFYTPDQETFLRMVDSWAKVEGIKAPAPEIHLKALQWSRFNNGRSGRTARQFIKDLKGKL